MLYPRRPLLFLLSLLFLALAPPAPAQDTFSFTTAQSPFVAGSRNQGNYSRTPDPGGDIYAHTSTNDNYVVGRLAGVDYRDFFSFDVSGLNLTGRQIASATLSVTRFDYVSDNNRASQTLNLFDVTTSASALKTTTGTGDASSNQAAYYGDLGTGSSYGSFSVPRAGQPTDTLNFGLNNLALMDIMTSANAHNFFSIGGGLTVLSGDFNEALFARSGGGGVALTVTLAETPAPPGLASALIGITVAGLKARRRRKSEHGKQAEPKA